MSSKVNLFKAYNSEPLIPLLLSPLTHVLTTTPHDPAPPATLLAKLLQPMKLVDILQVASEATLTLALESPSPAVNLLALDIISKAKSPSDVAIISLMPSLVLQLISCWLSAPSVDVGYKATEMLADLLEMDSPNREPGELNAEMNGASLQLRAAPQGQGLLWRRIFTDQEIYARMFDLCGGIGVQGSALDERQRTLAQARVMRILPRLAHRDMDALCVRLAPRGDSGVEHGEKGLLWWVSTNMVNREDVLMRVTHLDYFNELIHALGQREVYGYTSPQLEFFKDVMNEMAEKDAAIAEVAARVMEHEDTDDKLRELLSQVASGPAFTLQPAQAAGEDRIDIDQMRIDAGFRDEPQN